jgi:uncharacterized protein YlzI (FlbEa/FlbD family)
MIAAKAIIVNLIGSKIVCNESEEEKKEKIKERHKSVVFSLNNSQHRQ